jgi:acetyl-CoA carboxylase biotin carboxyl carrier protein
VSLTPRDVQEILRALENSSFDTLDLEMNGVQLHLRRSGASAHAPRTAATQSPAPTASAVADALSRAGAQPVPAPLLGIFYRAPKPGEPPFVQPGDRVGADTIIGIIEVMKLMNSVRAGIAGEVVEINAPNGELVEFGQPLLWVRPD